MSLIYWDTMLFAYWLEGSPEYASRVQAIHARMRERGDRLYTSCFTLGELLVAPLKAGLNAEAQRLTAYLKGPDVALIEFTTACAETFAQMRATSGVSPADAIHLACASNAGVDLFLTNDSRLQKLVVPGIKFIGGLDVNTL